VWDVTHLYNGTENKGEPTMATVQFTTRFMIEIGSRTRTDTHMFDVWVQHLKRLYTDNHEACRWLLTMLSKDDDKFVSLLLHCPMERVRRAFASIILHAMHQLLPQERHLYPRYIAMVTLTFRVCCVVVCVWCVWSSLFLVDASTSAAGQR
jgi:hypothetical protein